MFAEFEKLEFQAVDGVIREFYGCSLIGVLEFEERLKELEQVLSDRGDEVSVEELWRRDRRVRHLITKLLQLNGIDPSWVNWQMVSELLFGRIVDGRPVEGYLITLNRPHKPQRPATGEGIGGKAGLIALIASYCGSIQQAYTLASTIPARELFQVLEAKNEQAKTPEQKEKERFDDWAAEQKARAKARRQAAA